MIRLRVLTTLCLSLGVPAIRADHASIVVASDGSGHFRTVQSAIDSIPGENTEPRVIVIKPGKYKERVVISESKTFISLRGEHGDAGKTILTFNRYSGMDDPEAPGKKVSFTDSETVLIRPDNFSAENITFENSAGVGKKAVAVRTMRDKQIFRNCRFLGWQDTLYVDGKRTYFRDCYVEGRVDFIFGSATAVFEKCHIHAIDGGVITAPSTDPETPFGLVFLKSKVTCAEDRSYLGTPWKKGAAVAFIEHHKTARFFEYKNTGPGANPHHRPAWTRQLSDAEAKSFTVENILSGEDRWNPKSD